MRWANFKLVFGLLIFSGFLVSQDVPIPVSHQVHDYLARHITLGNIKKNDFAVRPFTYNYILESLQELSSLEFEMVEIDRKLLHRFINEFSIDNFSDKVDFPVSKSNLKNVGKTAFSKYDLNNPEPHFLSYKDDDIYAWMDMAETARLEVIDENVYQRYTDEASILGSLSDNLSFFIGFKMNRFIGDSILVYQIEDYRNEDNPYFDFVNWTIWYQSNATFNISTEFGDFQLGKTPVIWGYSPNNSPILSSKTQTFPFINYKYKNDFVGFHFIHGSLLPYESAVIHDMEEYPQKYLAAHRIEFYLGDNFNFSFNEMVIYGNRPFEVEYLIPVNFYWMAEHNLGDKDNLLMALDCTWRIKPGLTWYNTLFWDELAWEKLFSKWWGNKFVLQSGVHWVSKSNPYLIDLRIEGTISRPWTYTHEEFINSYASAEIGLGLPQGPNSQSLFVELGLWPSYRWNVKVGTMLMRKGIELGSSVLHNYNLRDRELDEDTPYILGQSNDFIEIQIESNYTINQIINIFGKIQYNSLEDNVYGYLGMNLNW